MTARCEKRILIFFTLIAIFYLIITPLTIIIAHSLVMSKCTYKKYDSNKYLVYADVAENFPREKFAIASGKNNLSAWLYGKENTKGLIIVSPGHRDSNDIKLYEIMYFVDAGFQVLCFDYSGCYTSEGSAFGGYTQAVYDLDSVLSWCDKNESFSALPLYLFGHSLGGYAVTAVLNYPHRVDAVVSASGFNTAKEQWECSVKRFTGPLYFLIKPINLLFIHFKYGADKNLSAVSGINKAQIPVLVISAENDIFYGGKTSPIYQKQNMITNQKCKFLLMDKPEHNGHYSYFLTDAAIEYQKTNPKDKINKNLYMEHDKAILEMICSFFTN